MPLLASRAPCPSLAEHPEFPLMLLATLERFHCTLAEVREDYWQGRVWRALAGDPALEGRVARVGVGNVLLTAPGRGPMSADRRERVRWRLHVHERLVADTGRASDVLGVAIECAEERIEVGEACVRSLLAQAIGHDPRWMDLSSYADDLAPVIFPVAYTVAGIVAA
jgi:hypothetical protein